MKNFLQQAWLSYQSRFNFLNVEEFLLSEFLMPFFSLCFYCLIAGFSFQTTNLARWIVGNAFLLCVNVCIFLLGSTMQIERGLGSLRQLMVAPTHKLWILLGKSFFPSLFALVNVFIGLFCGAWLFGLTVPLQLLPSLFLTIICGLIATSAFGLFLSTFCFVYDSMHFLLNLVAMGLTILTGANFPLAQLPHGVQVLAQFLPLTHAIAASNALFAGKSLTMILPLLALELLIGLIFLCLTIVALHWAEKLARQKATIDFY